MPLRSKTMSRFGGDAMREEEAEPTNAPRQKINKKIHSSTYSTNYLRLRWSWPYRSQRKFFLRTINDFVTTVTPP